jgi:hypothetical protein
MKKLSLLLIAFGLLTGVMVNGQQPDSFLNNPRSEASLNLPTMPPYNYSKDILVYYKPMDQLISANIPVTKTNVDYSVVVRDLLGNNILNTTIHRSANDNSTQEIPIKHLNSGIYLVTIYTGQEAMNGKFIVKE